MPVGMMVAPAWTVAQFKLIRSSLCWFVWKQTTGYRGTFELAVDETMSSIGGPR